VDIEFIMSYIKCAYKAKTNTKYAPINKLSSTTSDGEKALCNTLYSDKNGSGNVIK
jgi:hypothetical protein